jgi:hypothetical protein
MERAVDACNEAKAGYQPNFELPSSRGELTLLLAVRLQALHCPSRSVRRCFEVERVLRRLAKVLSQALRQKVDHLQRVGDLIYRHLLVFVHVSRLSAVAGCGMIPTATPVDNAKWLVRAVRVFHHAATLDSSMSLGRVKLFQESRVWRLEKDFARL